LSGQSDIDKVRDASDLLKVIGEHVVLKPRGREHVGLCPFHDDRSPSMAVVTHKGNAFYKCFACGAGGDAFDFVMNYHKMDFGEALRYLAQKAGITLTPWKGDEQEERGPKKIDVRKANAFAATFFKRTLQEEALGAAAREAIAQRCISPEMVEAFMLGAAPDSWDAMLTKIHKQNLPPEVFAAAGLLKPRKEGGAGGGFYDAFRNRLMFPICDKLGVPIAFGARKINPDDEPKYLNSAESAAFNKSKTLYGLHLAQRAIINAHVAIVTEGYTDVIACHQAGIANVVATLGTALTREHARELSKICDTVILLFDGDEPGMKAADRALEVFFAETVDIKICVLPDGLDPDELLKQDGGRARFDTVLKASVDALQYKLDRFRVTLEGQGMSGRQKRLEAFLAELAGMGFGAIQGVRKQMVLMRIAELMRLPVNVIEQTLGRFSQRSERAANAPASANEAVEVTPEPWQEGEVSPLRAKAEFELLGVAIFDPAIALKVVREQSSGETGGVFAPSRFQHPASTAIAEVVDERLSVGETFTVQQLMAALADESHRQTASRLYFEGQRACGERDDQALAALQHAIAAMQAVVHRERLDEALLVGASAGEGALAADPLARMQQILQHRRQAGSIASAIPRGVRS
jgi:DNA primase